MKGMARLFVAVLATVVTALLSVAHGVDQAAQGGDQFLDGIGENGLVARYVLERTPRTRRATSSTRRCAARRVSSRTRVPPRAAADRRRQPRPAARGNAGRRRHDQRDRAGCSCRRARRVRSSTSAATRRPAVRTAGRDGLRAAVLLGGGSGRDVRERAAENQWMHFAVVLDPAAHVLTSYVDGARTGQATDVKVTPAQVLPQGANGRLFLGRSQDDGAPTLHGRLRDVRLYRIALGDQQVATIRSNALRRRAARRAAAARRRRRSRPPTSRANRRSRRGSRTFPTSRWKRSSARCRGCRPRFRRRTATTATGPDVRVIWPSPTDNSAGAAARHLHGHRQRARHDASNRRPRSSSRCRSGRTTPPSRLVEAFPLSQVVLDRDAKGRETPFIRNRDKFIRGLAATQSRQLPLQLQGRVRPAAAGGRASRSTAGTTRRRGCAGTRAATT